MTSVDYGQKREIQDGVQVGRLRVQMFVYRERKIEAHSFWFQYLRFLGQGIYEIMKSSFLSIPNLAVKSNMAP